MSGGQSPLFRSLPDAVRSMPLLEAADCRAEGGGPAAQTGFAGDPSAHGARLKGARRTPPPAAELRSDPPPSALRTLCRVSSPAAELNRDSLLPARWRLLVDCTRRDCAGGSVPTSRDAGPDPPAQPLHYSVRLVPTESLRIPKPKPRRSMRQPAAWQDRGDDERTMRREQR